MASLAQPSQSRYRVLPVGKDLVGVECMAVLDLWAPGVENCPCQSNSLVQGNGKGPIRTIAGITMQEESLSSSRQKFGQRYQEALREYLGDQAEASLKKAYELGREAMKSELGVMELAKAHERAIRDFLGNPGKSGANEDAWKHAATFFAESLWSVEMMQRGFREANRMLQDLNAMLDERAQKLANTNKDLEKEIAERLRAERALRQSEEDLRRLSRQILVAVEQERKRISRELHDEVGQALTAINVNLAMLKRAAGGRSCQARIVDTQKLLEHAMETMHSFSRELRPAMLDDLGLIPAIRAYVRNFGKRTGLKVRFSAVPDVERLGAEEKTLLYRVTQEGLTNVVKHAKAVKATVAIRRKENAIQMEVQDNGKGFLVDEEVGFSGKGRRLGLLGIRERVRLVNGEFTLASEPGCGTRIRVEIPFEICGTKTN